MEDGYDTLVNKLTLQRRYADDEDLLANVKFHLGVGLASTVFTMVSPNGQTIYASQRGIELNLGVDLLNPHWIAEGSVLNFGEQSYDNKNRIALREFDLKIAWLGNIDKSMQLKVGAGLAARYLKANYAVPIVVDTPQGPSKQDHWQEQSFSTPSSVVFLGLVNKITDTFSLGADIATRNSLTDETPDQNSLDLSLRIDGHF